MATLRSLLLGGPIWGILAARSISCSATNSTSSTNCLASNEYFGPPFNSTGTASFNLGILGYNDAKLWYLTIGFKDKRDSNATSYQEMQTVNSYMSLPDGFINSADGNHTSMCAYRLGEQNSTAAENNGSCRGVLSDACTKYIQTFREAISFSNGKCPEFSPEEGCGDGIIAWSTPVTFTTTNSNCSTHGLPGVPDIPDNYTTQGLFGVGWPYGDKDNNSLETYDLHVRQPNPMLLVFGVKQGHGDNTSNATIYASQLLCVTPDHVAAGSHGAKSSAIALRINKAMVLVIAAISMVTAHMR